MTLMDLVASLKLDVSQFLSGSQAAKSEAQALKNELSGVGQQAGLTTREVKQFNDQLSDIAGKTAGVGAALSAGLTLPMVELASASLQLASSFEQAGIALSTMMRSGTQAQQFLTELKAFAASSPFEFPDLLEASRRLQALGFEARATIPIMTAIGDAVAGLGGGKALIDRITLALGQMNQAGHVTVQDMRQLTEAGINAWQMLADASGRSIAQIQEDVHNKLISSATAIPQILEGIERQFGGMMTNQMTTIAGQWSNLKDQMSFILADIGQALRPFAQTVLDMAGPVLQFIRDIILGFQELPPGMQGSIVAMAALAAAVGPVLLAFAGFMATVSSLGSLLGVTGLAGILSTLTPILLPLAAAILAAGAAWEAWQLQPIQNAVSSITEAIRNFWTGTLQPFIETVGAAGLAFVNFAAGIIGSGLEAAWDALQAAGSALYEVFNQVVSALSPLWEAFGNILDALSPLLQPIQDLIGFLAEMVVGLVGEGLIAAWEALKIVLGVVGEAVSVLVGLFRDSLIAVLGTVATVIREVSSVFSTLFKNSLKVAVDSVTEFLTAIRQIPGIKQIIDGISTTFTTMKEKIVGAVSTAREQIRSWGEDTKTSMRTAKDAVDAAQRSYDDILRKFQAGKATEDDLRRATENLSRAKADFRAELERVRPRIEEVFRAVQDADRELDNATRAVNAAKAAFDSGKGSAQGLADAQVRLRDAATASKDAHAQLDAITAETGQTFQQFTGKVSDVKNMLGQHNEHAQTAKDKQAALKAAVEQASTALQQAWQDYRNGIAPIEAVQAAVENLKNQQANLHPERVAEEFVAARQREKDAAEANMRWYEETYVPRYSHMIDQINQQNSRMQDSFNRAHELMRSSALQPIEIKVELDKRLPEEVLAMKQFMDAIAEAYRQLGITSSATIQEHARQANIYYEQIKNSGVASAKDIERAELAALQATIQAERDAGIEIPKEQRKRLEELQRDLDTSLKAQKTAWETLTEDLKKIGEQFNRDMARAFVDLFEGKGWDGFKNAGIRALESIAEKVLEVAIEYVEKKLMKAFLQLIEEGGILDAIKAGMQAFGGFVKGIFEGIGHAISSLFNKLFGNFISQTANISGPGGGGTPGGSDMGGAEGGFGGIIMQGLQLTMQVMSFIQGMHQSTDLGRIEENTRFTQIGIIGGGGIIEKLNAYLPGIKDIHDFGYNVVAPLLTDISDTLTSKLLEIYRGIVVDLKNVIIELKDTLHESYFKLDEISSRLGDLSVILNEIKDSASATRMASDTIANNSMRFDTQGLQQAINNEQAAITNSLSNMATSLLGSSGFGGLATALSNIDPTMDLQNAATTISNNVASSIASLDLRGSINTLSGNIMSGLSSMTSALSAVRSAPAPQPSVTNYINVNGQSIMSSSSGLASQLMTYGVRF